MARKKIEASKLHDLLTHEFRGTAGDHCLKCRIPMPVRIDAKAGGPNWRVASGGECPNLCHTILEDLVAKFSKDYDLN
jgi:hypothetical protein